MENEPRKRGRPRVWENAAAKHRGHRGHRQRQAAVSQALGELLHAVLNACLEDPELQRRVNAATDDVAVLEALTAHYQARPWNRRAGKAVRVNEGRTSDAAAPPPGTDLQKPLDDNQRRVQRMLGRGAALERHTFHFGLSSRARTKPRGIAWGEAALLGRECSLPRGTEELRHLQTVNGPIVQR